MNWYAEWFDEEYVRVYQHRDLSQAQRDVDFARRALNIQAGHGILDLCCGNGRHIAALQKAGYSHVTGIDLSRTLLDLARGDIPEPMVVQADMRRLPFRSSFDIVLNLFTSFGYFESDTENRQVIQSMHDVLAPGGGFVLDYLNPLEVKRTLEPFSERVVEDRRVIEERSIDTGSRRVVKRITIETPSDIKHYEESVRLYSLDEMQEHFRASGLVVEKVCGDFDFGPVSPEAPRLIFIGKRPE
jgi:SAM-dependent methyltransferase